ncbi:hypothetical protein ACWHAM_12345 [Paenibacillus terrae]|uniref:Uncharacterized protein n=1 Tax=Paenibacillus terrae (strain HPL-003) TaxID=985665 RepID=G7VZM2_PAETH|nr:hypothetical protein [Paenibacillus terrae]AET57264.1 hypothetical protein HPL003_02415 [Paenibacillus terrae HPL-003]
MMTIGKKACLLGQITPWPDDQLCTCCRNRRVAGEAYFIELTREAKGTEAALFQLKHGYMLMLEPGDQLREDAAAQAFFHHGNNVEIVPGRELMPAFSSTCRTS